MRPWAVSSCHRVTQSPCHLVTLLLLLTPGGIYGWSWQHDDATRLAATISPEPFKSNSRLCAYGSYPDSLPDHAVTSHEEIYLRRLFTFEAIDALRAGDAPKAMFLASAATHFLTDYCCIAHSRAWYSNGKPDDPWTKFLPRKYQTLRIPRVKKEVYYPHLKGNWLDTCLDLPEPAYNLDNWRKFQGSINAYFDTMPSVYALVTPEMLRRPVDWTATDADEYARWYGSFIALDMLDPASLAGAPLRLRDAAGMKAVCVEELINGAAQCAAYFAYLCTAAKTHVSPSLQQRLPDDDKLMALAKGNAVVAISDKAPWPVERAANVLAMEILRAQRRLAAAPGAPQPTRKAADYVIRVSPDHASASLQGRNAVLLLTPDDRALAKALKVPEVPQDASGLITVEKSGESGQNILVVLRGATRQDALYLVDYLLDLCDAPLNGLWPAAPVVEAVKKVWPGWTLLLGLRNRQGEAAVTFARKFRGAAAVDKQAVEKARNELKPLTKGWASQEEWWSHFLLDLPLPDGRRAPEMIEKGTDYSAWMDVVRKQSK